MLASQLTASPEAWVHQPTRHLHSTRVARTKPITEFAATTATFVRLEKVANRETEEQLISLINSGAHPSLSAAAVEAKYDAIRNRAERAVHHHGYVDFHEYVREAVRRGVPRTWFVDRPPAALRLLTCPGRAASRTRPAPRLVSRTSR